PTMFWRLEHHFKELEGSDKTLLHPNFPGVSLGTLQSIEFRLHSKGASVASGALVTAKSIPPRHFDFDKPFLIYLKKRDAKHPFFVMWVDNAELLEKAR